MFSIMMCYPSSGKVTYEIRALKWTRTTGASTCIATCAAKGSEGNRRRGPWPNTWKCTGKTESTSMPGMSTTFHFNFFPCKKALSRFRCEECNLSWKTRLGLHRHKIANHSTDPKYECHICGYRSLSADLKLHLATHEAPKLSCDVCGKLLRTKATLQAHMRIHTGANPYRYMRANYWILNFLN